MHARSEQNSLFEIAFFSSSQKKLNACLHACTLCATTQAGSLMGQTNCVMQLRGGNDSAKNGLGQVYTLYIILEQKCLERWPNAILLHNILLPRILPGRSSQRHGLPTCAIQQSQGFLVGKMSARSRDHAKQLFDVPHPALQSHSGDTVA